MEKFSVKNYDNLKSAEEIIINMSNKLRQELDNCNSNLRDLFSESTFYGPIADHVESALNIINTATNNNINTLNDIASSINVIGNNYVTTDSTVSNDIGGI